MTESVSQRRVNVDALRLRLRQIGSAPRTAPAQPQPVRSATPLAECVGGEEVDGCHVITVRYGATHEHAGLALRALWECDGRTVATLAKDTGLEGFDFRRTLFLDTETNGLAGGAGTYAFLVGVAYWDEEGFHVQQLFMRHPGEEGALLAALSPLLDRFDSFVTFNGKSFDLPVLETRYILARQARALKARPHLDLLHPARRLWKLRLEACNLGTLEQRILGTMRDESDVPGWMVPRLYNDYLRDGNPYPLKGVFYHNHQDLLALAALALHMLRICADPEEHSAPHGQDYFSLARLYEDCGEWEQAERCYRRAITAPMPNSLRGECVRRLSFLLKKQGRWDEATGLWRSMLGRGELYPYEELAKYHEHQSRDLPAAERAVLAAFAAARDRKVSLSPGDSADLRHRLERIRGKLARQDGTSPV
ncbi:MAG TPA: ribonuclease H-like domain-containing protein [Ardenticatenaceae bacterium]